MELTLNIRFMGQEAERGLKFLHDLDIGYENLHKSVYHFRVQFYSSFFKGTQIIGCTVSCMAKLLFIKIRKKVAEFSWTPR